MLRNIVFAAVAIALVSPIAMAAPATAVKKAPAAITATVKAENVAPVKHHAKAKPVKTTTTARHKAKTTTIKS